MTEEQYTKIIDGQGAIADALRVILDQLVEEQGKATPELAETWAEYFSFPKEIADLSRTQTLDVVLGAFLHFQNGELPVADIVDHAERMKASGDFERRMQKA